MGPQGHVRHAFDARMQKGRGKSVSMQSGALPRARNQLRTPAASSRYADATWGRACDKVIATCCPPASYALTRRQPNHRRHKSRMPMRSRSKGRRTAATAGPARRTVGVRLVVDLLQPQQPPSREFSARRAASACRRLRRHLISGPRLERLPTEPLSARQVAAPHAFAHGMAREKALSALMHRKPATKQNLAFTSNRNAPLRASGCKDLRAWNKDTHTCIHDRQKPQWSKGCGGWAQQTRLCPDATWHKL